MTQQKNTTRKDKDLHHRSPPSTIANPSDSGNHVRPVEVDKDQDRPLAGAAAARLPVPSVKALKIQACQAEAEKSGVSCQQTVRQPRSSTSL